jgi:hypothetical protein
MKKGQAWGVDLIAAMGILLSGIMIFYLYTLNTSDEGSAIFSSLKSEGNGIMEEILFEGYPLDWDEDNVIKIGIFSNDKINETKLVMFYNVTNDRYAWTKRNFNTNYDYFLFFDENISDGVSGIGKPGIDIDNLNAKNLIKISRVVVRNNKPSMIYLYVWEE